MGAAAESIRAVVVQYAGCYREAFLRLSGGGPETYHSQRYSVDSIGRIAARVAELAFIVCNTERRYDERLPNGVRAIGAGCHGAVDGRAITGLLDQLAPNRIIIGTPMMPVIRWARRRRVRSILALADSFRTDTPGRRLKAFLLARELNARNFEWVANHNLPAATSLLGIGVSPAKVLAWDWPATVSPADHPPKRHPGTARFRLLFVGSVEEAKGVGDLLRATAFLRARGLDVEVQFVGAGDVDGFRRVADGLGLGAAARFVGRQPHAAIVPTMRGADIVVVPSRHEYPEGLPMTIYEALCSRTPLVVSDHPMFRGRLDGIPMFPAGDAAALGEAVSRLLSDPPAYERQSMASDTVWERLQMPLKYADLLESWLFTPDAGRCELGRHRLRPA